MTTHGVLICNWALATAAAASATKAVAYFIAKIVDERLRDEGMQATTRGVKMEGRKKVVAWGKNEPARVCWDLFLFTPLAESRFWKRSTHTNTARVNSLE